MTYHERMCRRVDPWARAYCRVYFALTVGWRLVLPRGVLVLTRPYGWRLLFGFVYIRELSNAR